MRRAGIAAVAVVGLLAMTGCKDSAPGSAAGGPPGGAPSPAEVAVIEIQPRRVELSVELPGRTSPFRVAEVRPQVGGLIRERSFEEGSEVTQGQKLYRVDPATYRAAVASAEADVARAQATVGAARAKAQRSQTLLRSNGVSAQDRDDAVAAQRQAEAAVAAAQAAVEAARIDLARTEILSPIAGRIGKSAVTEGALVTASQTTPLAVVQQLDPIYVDLVQPAAEAMATRRAAAAGQVAVVLHVPGDDQPRQGSLQFADVTVDQGTGTVQLRAIVPNPGTLILPGAYVRATVSQGVIENGITVPQRAVSRAPDGSGTVWVVDAQNKAAPRRITTGRAVGADWLVSDGLNRGDRVVVEGLQRLRQPGAEVKPVPFGAPPAGPAGAAAAGAAAR